MKVFSCFLLLGFALNGGSSVVATTPFHPQRSVTQRSVRHSKSPGSPNSDHSSVQLVTNKIARGGAIEPFLDPDMTAKVALAFGALTNIVGILGIEQEAKRYGFDKPDTVTAALGIGRCAITLCGLLLIGLQVFYDVPFQQAVGYSTIPYALFELHMILNDKNRAIGLNEASGYFLLAVQFFVTYATLSEASFAGAVIKAYGIHSGLNGLAMVLAPKLAYNVWNLTYPSAPTKKNEKDRQPVYDIVMKLHGASALGHFLGICLPAFSDMPVLKTLGWMYVPWGVVFLQILFSKELEKVGIPAGGFLFWIAICVVVGINLLA